jgi:Ohr subfamily peroxiredoxin
LSNQVKILYTAEATAEGGREGHARTSDGRLEVDLDVPAEMGGAGGPGTNPEQLFATGYAACFQSALFRIAAGCKLDLTGSRVTARVGIGPAPEGGFGLTVALDLDAPSIGPDEASELMERAHQVCPYSRVTRGNVDVTLTVAGPTPPQNVALTASRVRGQWNPNDRPGSARSS